jgi:hypothetical protein
MFKPTKTLLIAYSVATFLAACGSSQGAQQREATAGSGSLIESPELSAADWAARADAICTAAKEASSVVENPQTVAESVVFVEQLGGIVHNTEEKLRALGAPPSEEEHYEGLLAAYERTASGFEQTADLFRGLDQSADLNSLGLEEQTDLENAFGDVSDAYYVAAATALQLGSRKCGAAAITTVGLKEQRSSGQSGTAEITPIDDHHMHVVLTLRNAPIEAESASVYIGHCDTLLPVEGYELTEVANGRSEGDLDTSLPELAAQLHHYSIVIMGPGDFPESVVACGELPVP